MSTLENYDESIFEKPWDLDDFKFGKPLGKGRFGRVYLAKEMRTKYQHLIAIKIMFINTLLKNKSLENFRRECQYHLTLKHPNVIEFHGWFYDDRKIYYILEFAPYGNLFSKISQGPLDEKLAATYALQTVKGLIYIHSKDIIHRDLKPENLLLGYFGEIKIADFGWANLCPNDENLDLNNNPVCKSLAGTIAYLCPEIINEKGHDKKVDIWCLGVLCFEMLAGKPPFDGKTDQDLLTNITNVKFSYPSGVKKLARNLISKLLVKKPNERLELEEVIFHEWIQTYANKDDTYMKYYNYE